MVKKIISVSSLASLFYISQSLYASGFSIIEHSASGLGQAFAGASAVAEDASTIYFNPAGMTFLEGSQITAGIHIIKPKTSFNDAGTQATLAGTIPVALNSASGGDAGGYNFVPNFYYVTEINNALHFGIGVNSPVGLNTSYDDNWMGRYTSIESDLKSMNINPSIAFKASEKLSLGIGVSVQYLKVKLVNKSYLCGHPQLAPSCNPTSASEVIASDATTTMKGDGWSAGFNLGMIYQPIKSTRIGLAYRSAVKHDLSGDLNAITNSGFSLANKNITADMEVPETLSLSLTHQTSSKLMLLADITYTGWSRFEELRVSFDDGSPDDVTEEKWSDSMRYSIGAKYQLSPTMILRTGIAHDRTPIDDQYRTSRIPGDHRTWLSLGISYQLSNQLSMDIGYAHLWVKAAKINEHFDGLAGAMQGELAGEYDSSVDILSAQVNWKF
ncbi:MAG: outer membrane protein transport protein [Pseudomonadota bacterium]